LPAKGLDAVGSVADDEEMLGTAQGRAWLHRRGRRRELLGGIETGVDVPLSQAVALVPGDPSSSSFADLVGD
jgi:hypothetical protein